MNSILYIYFMDDDSKIKNENVKYWRSEILREHLWFALTSTSFNFALMGVGLGIPSSNSIHLNSLFSLLASVLVSILALRLIIKRAMDYHDLGSKTEDLLVEIIDGKKKFDLLKGMSFVIKEDSGSLFYCILVMVSLIGVILAHIPKLIHFLQYHFCYC